MVWLLTLDVSFETNDERFDFFCMNTNELNMSSLLILRGRQDKVSNYEKNKDFRKTGLITPPT